MRPEPQRIPPQGNDLKRLGLFGGTFDPIHHGHLVCAEQLREALGLNRIWFVPCNMPPHKPAYEPASPAARIEMIRLAVEGYQSLDVTDVEVTRGGLSYSIDTLRHIRKSHPKHIEIWLLMGIDTYLDLPAWKEPESIIAECRFGVARRPGYEKRLPHSLSNARTTFVDITAIGISSTDIRKRLSLGKSIRFLVPDSVERYIRANDLYLPMTKS